MTALITLSFLNSCLLSTGRRILPINPLSTILMLRKCGATLMTFTENTMYFFSVSGVSLKIEKKIYLL
jgi:hypothetical protein